MDKRKISKLGKFLNTSFKNEDSWQLYTYSSEYDCLKHTSGYILQVDTYKDFDFPKMACLTRTDKEYLWEAAQALRNTLIEKRSDEEYDKLSSRNRDRRRRIFREMVSAGLGLKND